MSIGNENSKPLKDSKLRHIEYYNLQSQFDELYKRSRNNEIFDNLMDIIISPENVLLAYRNIKNNSGSNTPGTDKLSIQDIAKLTQEEMIQRVRKWTIVNKKDTIFKYIFWERLDSLPIPECCFHFIWC